jgi:DNA-binding beta-propeller fold protein YncE
MLMIYRMFRDSFLLSILFAFCLVLGCAMQKDVQPERYFWPQPPDEPRIEWLKTYSSQLDIEKSTSQRFWAAIAGDDAPQALLKPVEVRSFPELNKFFVSDIGKSAVMVFDLAGRELRTLVVPDGAPLLQVPLSVAVDRDGSIYVLERRSSSVLVFDRAEKYQRVISLKSVSVLSPTSMLIDRNKGLMYVSDAATRKIVVTDLQGIFVRSIDGANDPERQFNLPIAMALNSKGNLVVADAFNVSIQTFDPTGRFLGKFGQRGDSAGSFQLIKSLAVDSSDNIYVVDGRAHNISIFNEHGELLFVFGGFYASLETGKLAPGGFAIPVGIDIDSNDKIFVVDQMNTRVQVFQYFPEGSFYRNKAR